MRNLVVLILLLISCSVALSQPRDKFRIQHADNLEVSLGTVQETTYVSGSVIFESGEGQIYCDSAVWIPGRTVLLRGNVVIDDPAYSLTADRVDYDLLTGDAVARGQAVELWSRDDSILAVGPYAFYNRDRRYFYMERRPTVLLRYPDSANMITVIGDVVQYDAPRDLAEASGNVVITSKDFTATSGCAIMHPKENSLDLTDNPVALRGQSRLSGKLISVYSDSKFLKLIDVLDSARAEFTEPIKGMDSLFDKSILSGRRIMLDFDFGVLREVTAWGQAYSWYLPSPKGKPETTENTVSGDTIRFAIEQEELRQVAVVGGAVGTFRQSKQETKDSVQVTTTDSVDYRAQDIKYAVSDSVIRLTGTSNVKSGDMTLEAHRITFATSKRILEAYSADILGDTFKQDTTLTNRYQPNPVPVILQDGKETVMGDYLEYSLATEKGKVYKTKSKYETGYYYGEKVFRANRETFYIEDGRFSTCDLNEPHFHFASSQMKVREEDKIVARPVVLYIGRLPIVALPYYVFPLKRGRHSGLLPFTLGNIERGERYIRNVGYYWAASEYWDVQSAIDYYDRDRTVNFYGKLNYKVLYKFDGQISGNMARETRYNSSSAAETGRTRWTLSGQHRQDISPSFRIDATGQYQSDKQYYQDFSSDFNSRLDRSISGKVNMVKRFGRSVSLSGEVYHNVNLDTDRRNDRLPSLSLSLPTWSPFGSAKSATEGIGVTHWYHDFRLSWRPSLLNSSDAFNSVLGVDGTGDTLKLRNHRDYLRFDHGVTMTLPKVTLARYFRLVPSVNYSENWYRIIPTDYATAQRVKPDWYRTYYWSTGANLSTDLYGTVYPNLFGLLGLRQVITPSVSYGYSPKLNMHPQVRSYAGGGAGSDREASRVGFSINQVYQAKVKDGDAEKSVQLLVVNSNFSYNFKDTLRPLSDLSTTFQTSLLRLQLSGNLVHSFYRPNANETRFWSPYLQSFSFSTSFGLSGRRFLFDERAVPVPRLDDTLPIGTSALITSQSASGGWSLSGSYSYSESGREKEFRKTSFLNFNLQFSLTGTTRVTYRQAYDFNQGKTINNEISISKILHCWEGNIYWVPIGSNRGYGFRLNVIALPDIKIDNQRGSVTTQSLFNRR